MMRKYEPFLDHPDVQQFSTMKIGEGLDNPYDISRSHFTNVMEYVDVKLIKLVCSIEYGRGSQNFSKEYSNTKKLPKLN